MSFKQEICAKCGGPFFKFDKFTTFCQTCGMLHAPHHDNETRPDKHPNHDYSYHEWKKKNGFA